MTQAIVFAGIAEKNPSLFRRLRVPLGDPAAWFQIGNQRIALVRDIEAERVRSKALADETTSPPAVAAGRPLDADRETATAQALAMALRAHGVTSAKVDRTFPMIYAHHAREAGIELVYDAEQGVLDRRVKTEEEIEHLAAAQAVTESVMEEVCSTIARAKADANGVLVDGDSVLTSERVREMATLAFLKHGYTMPHGAIIASTPQSADCHHAGSGPLMTMQPVIVDLFPFNPKTRYWGDCTRTVVHGRPSDEVLKMHQAVKAAKEAATARLVAGNTAASVHQSVIQEMTKHGYASSRGATSDEPTVQHGTGHGIGLEVHEPILLDDGGGELLVNEVFTIEPGLYGRRVGGVRIEDMVVVTNGSPRNLNRLHEGLDWRT